MQHNSAQTGTLTQDSWILCTTQSYNSPGETIRTIEWIASLTTSHWFIASWWRSRTQLGWLGFLWTRNWRIGRNIVSPSCSETKNNMWTWHTTNHIQTAVCNIRQDSNYHPDDMPSMLMFLSQWFLFWLASHMTPSQKKYIKLVGKHGKPPSLPKGEHIWSYGGQKKLSTVIGSTLKLSNKETLRFNSDRLTTRIPSTKKLFYAPAVFWNQIRTRNAHNMVCVRCQTAVSSKTWSQPASLPSQSAFPVRLNCFTAWYIVMLYGNTWLPINSSRWCLVTPCDIDTAAYKIQNSLKSWTRYALSEWYARQVRVGCCVGAVFVSSTTTRVAKSQTVWRKLPAYLYRWQWL